MKSESKLFVFFTFLLFTCNQKQNKNGAYKRIKWENGNVQSEGLYVRDSIKEGLFKGYYRSGKLKYEANYHNNKLNGLATQYFESEKRKSVTIYKDGIITGSLEEYFESGKIRLYQVRNSIGKACFSLEYLEDGSITRVKGSPIVETSFNKKNYKVGDTLKISFQAAKPKNSKVYFNFYDDSSTKQNSREFEVSEKDDITKYEKVLVQKGTMKWRAACLIKLNNWEKVKDEVFGELIVR